MEFIVVVVLSFPVYIYIIIIINILESNVTIHFILIPVILSAALKFQ